MSRSYLSNYYTTYDSCGGWWLEESCIRDSDTRAAALAPTVSSQSGHTQKGLSSIALVRKP